MPHASIALAKRPLRSVLRDELTERITSGRIPPGARLNETDIARELGVSQTPIREALLSLEGQAAIEAEPRCGFRVRPFTVQEATELYTLVGHLERFALEQQGAPTPHALDQLDTINAALGKRSVDAEMALRLDAQWHALLLENVPFAHLAEMIARLKTLLRRYEVAYMRSRKHVAVASEQHRAIVAELRRGKVAGAAKRLEENWRIGIAPMGAWLASAPAPAKRARRA
jgi:DNA-binding GntR family transcriptional regulator